MTRREGDVSAQVLTAARTERSGLGGACSAPIKQLFSYAKLAIRALCVFFTFELGIPTVPVNSLSLTCLLNFCPKVGFISCIFDVLTLTSM